jgi:tetratricopeptide (TPR) repeat protein
LPATWNVPHRRNPTFTGRDVELAELHAGLSSALPGASFRAISGLGGVGKTQLAVEYAYRQAADYDVVWWLRAEEAAQLAADFAELAFALRLRSRSDPDQRLAVEAARKWLAQNGNWLLIFDSARDPAAVAPYLGTSGTGHVIITSRHASWRGQAIPLALRELAREDSVAFLLGRSGRSDDGSAELLAEALGDLPLALAQAAAYMEESGAPISTYLELFEKRRHELLRRTALGETAPTVATTWDIAFQEAQSRSPAAGELLRLAAFLAADDIPREGLAPGAEYLPPALSDAVSDPLLLDEAIAALRRCSLVEAQESSLSVHRLVQAVVRDRLTDDEFALWSEAAVRVVFEGLSADLEEAGTGSPDRGRFLPHVLPAASHAEAAGVAREVTEQLLIRAAKYHLETGAFVASKDLLEHARDIATSIHGTDHAHVATIYTKLSRVLGELDDPAALTYAERALAIDIALYGEDHSSVARDYNNIAKVLRKRRDLAGAIRNVERALAIDERLYGPDDAELIPRLNDLGFLRRVQGDLDGARQVLESALARGEAAWGADHPDLGSLLGNLADVLPELAERERKAGRAEDARQILQQARGLLERAVAIGEATYGPNHYVVSMRRNNLGLLLRDLGDIAGALREITRALEIMKKEVGVGHRRVIQFEKNLEVVSREFRRKSGTMPAVGKIPPGSS